jgi:hypothetical protein
MLTESMLSSQQPGQQLERMHIGAASNHQQYQYQYQYHQPSGSAGTDNPSGSNHSGPELPAAPPDDQEGDSHEGVIVYSQKEEEGGGGGGNDVGNGVLYVRVNCKDRHGLLADIVRALRGIPVEVRKKEAALFFTFFPYMYKRPKQQPCSIHPSTQRVLAPSCCRSLQQQ